MRKSIEPPNCTCRGFVKWCRVLCEDWNQFCEDFGCSTSENYARLFEIQFCPKQPYFIRLENRYDQPQMLKLRDKELDQEITKFLSQIKTLSSDLGRKNRIKDTPLKDHFRKFHESFRQAIYNAKTNYLISKMRSYLRELQHKELHQKKMLSSLQIRLEDGFVLKFNFEIRKGREINQKDYPWDKVLF